MQEFVLVHDGDFLTYNRKANSYGWTHRREDAATFTDTEAEAMRETAQSWVAQATDPAVRHLPVIIREA